MKICKLNARLFNAAGCDIGVWPLDQFLNGVLNGSIQVVAGDRIVISE